MQSKFDKSPVNNAPESSSSTTLKEDPMKSRSDDQNAQLVSKLQISLKIDVVSVDDLTSYVNARQGRYQLMVYDGAHYTAVDIIFTPEMKSCVIMDGAGDPRKNYIRGLFSGMRFDRVLLSEDNIQNDAYSCEGFAFDHCVQASLEPDDFHDRLHQVSTESRYVSWLDFPPNFVWNAQSMSFLERYRDHVSSKKQLYLLDERKGYENLNFYEYIQRGTRKVLTKEGDLKPRNMSISDYIFSLKEGFFNRNFSWEEEEIAGVELTPINNEYGPNPVHEYKQVMDEQKKDTESNESKSDDNILRYDPH